MLESIDLSQALEIMNQTDKAGEPMPFDVSFRALNKYSNTGGKLNIYKGVKILKSKGTKSKANTLSHDNILETAPIAKNPNHWVNRTRNLELPNGEKRKIHIRLIISINGKQVFY